MPADLDGIAGAVEVYTGGEKQTKEQEDQVIWESKPVQRAPFTSRQAASQNPSTESFCCSLIAQLDGNLCMHFAGAYWTYAVLT